jgi:uncharacterized membrane protein YfcA
MFETSELALTAIAMVFASGFQAFTGFGFGLICTPTLALIFGGETGVQTAVLLLVLPSWFAASSAAFGLRREAPFPSIFRYIMIAPIGILVGVWLLDELPAWSLELVLILLLLQVLLSSYIGGFGGWVQHTVPSSILAGIAAGSLGTAGPPVVGWAQAKTEWEMPTRRAAMLFVFASVNPMRLPFYVAFGLMSNADLWMVALASIPLVSTGSWLGHRVAKHVSTEHSEIIVKLAMTALVIAMSIQAYRHFIEDMAA